MPRPVRYPVVIAVTACLAACATRAEIKSEPSDAGERGTYSAAPDKLRQAARGAVGSAEFVVREEGDWDGRWRLVASQGLASGTLGRLVRVVIAPGAPATVFVLGRSKLETDETRAADAAMAKDLQERIAQRLR